MAVPELKIHWAPRPQQFVIEGATNAHKLGLLQVAGVRFMGKGTDFWSVPHRFAPIYAVTQMFPFTWADDAAEAAYLQLLDHVTAITALRRGIDEATAAHLQRLLDPYGFTPKAGQAAAMVQLGSAGSAALFSGVGQGKTPTVAATLALYGKLPALVVAPPSVLYNWKNELARFGIEATVLAGTPAQRAKIWDAIDWDETRVIICSYDILKTYTRFVHYGSVKLKRCDECGGTDGLAVTKCETHAKEFNEIKWSVVIADEAHRLRDPSTARRRAFAGVRASATDCYLLTGTPIEDNPEDMWSMLNLLDPIEWPSSVKFKDRYCDMQPSWYGPDTVAGLNPRTRSEFDVVSSWRWRRDLPVGLPETVYEIRYCTLSPKERKAYDQMDKQMRAEAGDNVIDAINPLVKSGRLYQMAQAYCEVGDDEEVYLTDHSAKLDLMMDTLEDVGYEPLLLWFGSAQLLRLAEARLTKAGISYRSIHGGTSAKARQQYVDEFQAGEVDVMLLQTAAGGEGITLTRARVRIIVCYPHSNTQVVQLNARNERYGSEQHNELLCIELITQDTIEEDRMPERRAEKTARVKEILGS